MVRALLDKDQAAGEGDGAAKPAPVKAAPAPEAAAAEAAAAAAVEANPWRSNYHDRKRRETPEEVAKKKPQAPTLAMTPRCDFEFVAAPAPEPQVSPLRNPPVACDF